jgi:hypothetical protein
MFYIYGGIVKSISDRIRSLFSKTELEQLAKESSFCRRNDGKISPTKFLDLVIHGASEPGYLSLNQSAIEFRKQGKKKVSKEGINQRFNEQAVEFLRLLLEHTIVTQLSSVIAPDFLKDFPSLRIKDGTRFDLPPQLAEIFEGFGGSCTSEAGLCIQYEFDLKTLKFVQFKLTSANIPDSREANSGNEIFEAGELVLRDLGYFNLDNFARIEFFEAYYLSRLNPGVLVFDNNEQLCFKSLHEKMQRAEQSMVEMRVTVGATKRLGCRLVVWMVDEETCRKRIVTLEKNAKKKGYNLSDEARFRARFTLIITNLPESMVPASDLYSLYRLRWQVELMFKHWKSKLGIDKVQKMNEWRLKSMIYGKLLHITLSIEIISVVRQKQYRLTGKILSIDKCLKTIISDKIVIILSREKSNDKIEIIVSELLESFSIQHWQEKRKNRVNFEEIFDLFSCKSNI